MWLLSRLKELAESARLRITRRMHRLIFVAGGVFTAVSKERPDAIHALWNAIPWWAYLCTAVPFYFIVDALLHPGDAKAD